jgi:hypothetical protein
MNFLKVKVPVVFLLHGDDDFAFTELVFQYFKFLVELISFEFKEVVCIVQNDNDHLISDLI